MKKLALLLLVLSTGCSYYAHNFQVYVQEPYEDWLQEPTYDAARFWAPHGVDFLIGSTGSITIVSKELTPDRVGEFAGNGVSTGEVRIIPEMEDIDKGYITAIIAHELGHSVKMKHVAQSESLMAPVLEDLDENGNPFWSNLDQQEFDRTHPSSQNIPNIAEATHGGEVNNTELYTIE